MEEAEAAAEGHRLLLAVVGAGEEGAVLLIAVEVAGCSSAGVQAPVLRQSELAAREHLRLVPLAEGRDEEVEEVQIVAAREAARVVVAEAPSP